MMTPRQAGELLGALTAEILVLGLVWLVIVLGTLLVAKGLRRRVTLREVMRNRWILGIVAALVVLQMLSRLGGR